MPLGNLSEFCTPDDLILPEPSSHKPCHHSLEVSTVIPLIMSPSTQHFQPSSKLNLSPFMSVSRPSNHEHRIVSMYLFDCHPNWPPSVDSDGPNGVKRATEEDKNKVRRAWIDGPDRFMSMGQRKDKPIPCMGPLLIEHYIK